MPKPNNTMLTRLDEMEAYARAEMEKSTGTIREDWLLWIARIEGLRRMELRHQSAKQEPT